MSDQKTFHDMGNKVCAIEALASRLLKYIEKHYISGGELSNDNERSVVSNTVDEILDACDCLKQSIKTLARSRQ